jgi:hypothetical protein
VFGHGSTDYLPLIPRYVVAFGYYMRAFGHFSLAWRRALWFVSVLANCGYSLFILWETLERPSYTVRPEDFVIPGIFGAIAVISVSCAIFE